MASPIKCLTPEAEAARNIDDGIREGAANAAALDEAFMPLYPYMYFRGLGSHVCPWINTYMQILQDACPSPTVKRENETS